MPDAALRPRIRLSAALGASLALAVLALTLARPAVAVAGPTSGGADAVACAAVAHCSAVGSFTQPDGSVQGLLLTRTGGSWAPDDLLVLPGDAARNPQVALNALWCAPGGDCVTVGDYTDRRGDQLALVARAHDGVWSAAQRVNLPAGAVAGGSQLAELTALWCADASHCVAGGDFTGSGGNQQGFTVTLTGATPQRGVAVPLPANAAADPQVALTVLSCTSISACTVLGIYSDTVGNQNGLVLLGAPADFGETQLPLPSDAAQAAQQVQLNGLSCPAAGACTGVGAYLDTNGNERALVVQLEGTTVSTAAPILPANADPSSNPEAQLSAVACPAAGDCTMVGSYNDATPAGQGLLVHQSGTTLAPATELSLPAGTATDPQVGLDALACPATATCVATGSLTLADGAQVPLVAEETGDSWSVAHALTLPAAALAGTNQNSSLLGIACPTPGSCAAAGTLTDRAGNPQPLVISGSTTGWTAPVIPTAPPTTTTLRRTLMRLLASARPTPAAVGRLSHGGLPLSLRPGEAGTLSVTWRRGTTLLALARVSVASAAETARPILGLTPAGRRLLATGTRRVRLWIQTSFTPTVPAHAATVTVTRAVTVT
ncbi:MAG TPA: hypothetical protein VFN48_01240 [Solirubrobacteraceae bacterium]|nr:hypothetical protein [Solirubrobacteraceae bacterium]